MSGETENAISYEGIHKRLAALEEGRAASRNHDLEQFREMTRRLKTIEDMCRVTQAVWGADNLVADNLGYTAMQGVRELADRVDALEKRLRESEPVVTETASQAEPPAPLPPGWRLDGDGTAFRDDGVEVWGVVGALEDGLWYVRLPDHKEVPRPRYLPTRDAAIRRAEEVRPRRCDPEPTKESGR